MLEDLPQSIKATWLSCLRIELYKFGLGIVWENQGVENVQLFLSEFNLRLIDCHQQDLHDCQRHTFFFIFFF